MFESNDTFVEQVVRCVPKPKDNLFRYIFLGLTVLSVLGSFVAFASTVLVFVFGILTFVFWNTNYEYEYDYTNGSLTIARITNNEKRKVLVSVDSERVKLIAAEGTNESLKYDHVQLKTFDCTSRNPEDKVFVLVGHSEKKNEDFKIFFNPNEKLLAAMKKYNKRDIYE